MSENVTMKPRARVMWSVAGRASGWRCLSAAEFRRQNDLSPVKLSFWLRQQQRSTGGEDGALVEVPVTMASELDRGAAAIVRVELPSGLRVQVPVGADTTPLGWMRSCSRWPRQRARPHACPSNTYRASPGSNTWSNNHRRDPADPARDTRNCGQAGVPSAPSPRG